MLLQNRGYRIILLPITLFLLFVLAIIIFSKNNTLLQEQPQYVHGIVTFCCKAGAMNSSNDNLYKNSSITIKSDKLNKSIDINTNEIGEFYTTIPVGQWVVSSPNTMELNKRIFNITSKPRQQLELNIDIDNGTR